VLVERSITRSEVGSNSALPGGFLRLDWVFFSPLSLTVNLPHLRLMVCLLQVLQYLPAILLKQAPAQLE